VLSSLHSDIPLGTGHGVPRHLDPPPFQALRHGPGFILPAGVAFPRAVVAPDNKDLFAILDVTDDFLDWFLNGSMH